MNMVIYEKTPRELIRVKLDGTIVFSDDLTIEEAKYVIRELIAKIKHEEDQKKRASSTYEIFNPPSGRRYRNT